MSPVLEPEHVEIAFAGGYVRVERQTWPGAGEYEVIRQLGAAAVVPVTASGRVILVRQFRPPVAGDLVEIPAGLLDVAGEDALSCAGRELREETGFEADTIEFLGGVYVSPGSSDHFVHLFLARTPDEPAGTSEAGVSVVLEPFDVMVTAAAAGRVRDAKTALGLLMASARLARS